MPQKICLVLPGFAASELRLLAANGPVLWVSYTLLALGQIGKARLAPDGESPGPPDGVTCVPTGPLADYYQPTIDVLSRDLASAGYSVVGAGFDWRRSPAILGAQLAGTIRALATADNPLSIVAHSYGGIVARFAWYFLGQNNETNLVRRLVTLGTPHQGTYTPVAVFSQDEETFRQIFWLSGLVRGALSPGGSVILLPQWSMADLTQLAMTWPALYALFPLLDSADAPNDPYRANLYNAANWPAGLQPNAAWLDYSRVTLGTVLRDPSSMPPPQVLTTVAGAGVPTFATLETPAILGNSAGLSVTDQGDGRVTVTSALVAGAAAYTLPVRHSDLTVSSMVLDHLAAWVLAERPPPPPPPPTVTTAGTVVPILTGPPLTQFNVLDPDC